MVSYIKELAKEKRWTLTLPPDRAVKVLYEIGPDGAFHFVESIGRLISQTFDVRIGQAGEWRTITIHIGKLPEEPLENMLEDKARECGAELVFRRENTILFFSQQFLWRMT